MRFVDPQGVPITDEEWKALYRHPDLRWACRTENEDVAVETSWVGVVLAHEKEPRPWLCQAFQPAQERGLIKMPRKELEVHFLPSYEAAMACHDRLEEALLLNPSPKKKKR